MRYPNWAIAVAVVSVLVGASTVAGGDYAEGEGAAKTFDFALGVGVTFLFWYGVVLLVGWLYRRATAGRSSGPGARGGGDRGR